MDVNQIVLREINLPLVNAFETSFGITQKRRILLVEVHSDETVGWGECVAGEGPYYGYETVDTAWTVLTQWIFPNVLGCIFESPEEFSSVVGMIRGHPMAKACVEAALWDIHSQRLRVPLWRLIGGTREEIPCGAALGIQENPEVLLDKIGQEIESGYQKIKIKIRPGWDVNVVKQVREHFSEIPFMVDANSAYTLEDIEHLKQLDDYNLLMIEQPLPYDDLMDHATLQEQLKTPICLDESIRHTRDMALAYELKACQMVNIKIGRVGGLQEARRVHDFCQSSGIPVWCGGMLETGIGRAQNIALSTLSNFTIPGDVSASKRYYARDTVSPPIEMMADGHIRASGRPGIGYEPDLDCIEDFTVRREEFKQKSLQY